MTKVSEKQLAALFNQMCAERDVLSVATPPKQQLADAVFTIDPTDTPFMAVTNILPKQQLALPPKYPPPPHNPPEDPGVKHLIREFDLSVALGPVRRAERLRDGWTLPLTVEPYKKKEAPTVNMGAYWDD